MKRKLLLLAFFCAPVSCIWAQEDTSAYSLDSDDYNCETMTIAADAVAYEKSGITFRSYKPTQFLRASQESTVMPDYDHFQMNLSPEFHAIKNQHFTWGLVYNCEYSFYMDKLYSGPVLSRLQNPFAYAEWHFGKDVVLLTANGAKVKQLKHRVGLALAHESNGMILDDSAIYRSFTRSSSPLGVEERRFHNYNSMGWNYLAFRYKQKLKNSSRNVFDQGELGFEYRMYVNQSFGMSEPDFWDMENNLFLDPSTTGLSSSDLKKITIRNYDGIRFYICQEKHIPYKRAVKATHKVRLYYHLHTGLPVDDEWGSFNAYKLTHRFEVGYGWQWKQGWGSIYFIGGHEEGFRAYLSSYPCFRSTWFFGLQMGF
jgi:hypothetical protein